MTDEQRARAATIFDVARLAGVSHQTVSRVLNDLPNVRASTKARVEDAIKQLRYRPSTAARALVTRRSRTIGLMTTGAPDFGPTSTVIGFNEAAREARYAVSMASMLDADPDSVRASVDLLLRQNVEAIVLIAARRGALESIRGIELGVPLLAVESSGRGGFYSVAIDQYQGARNAVNHLISLGHKSILHLSGPADSMDAMERVRGWRDTLAEHDLVAREPMVGDWSPASGYRYGLSLSLPLDFTAIFVGNDQMSLGVIHALATRGVRVPDEVSIIGFDDIPEAEHFSPPLTTMRQDFGVLGGEIMAGVLEVLKDEDAHEHTKSVPQLIVRESTATPQV
ncbi:MAG: LacI family DNA-binding transcriptional regulator [Lacisediminihabitans sp.]